MSFDTRAWFVIIAFFTIMGGWYSYKISQPTTIEPGQAKADERVIFRNNRSDSGDSPFILTVTLEKETPSELVFEIEYFMSDTIKGDYNISIHPNMGDWVYTSNTMRAGINKQIITVTFRGKESPSTASDQMHVYINHYDNSKNKYIGKVFDRTIKFIKHWEK